MAMIPYADEPTLSTLYHIIQRFLQVSHRARVPTLGRLGKERGWGPPVSGPEAVGLDRFMSPGTPPVGQLGGDGVLVCSELLLAWGEGWEVHMADATR